MFKCFYSILKIYNFRNIVHFLKRILQELTLIQIISFVERSSFKPKWWNRELTLKCKLKCYVKPMKDLLGVSPSKGKEKIFLTLVGVGRVTVDLIRRSWVRFPPRSKEFFLYLVWFPDSLY